MKFSNLSFQSKLMTRYLCSTQAAKVLNLGAENSFTALGPVHLVSYFIRLHTTKQTHSTHQVTHPTHPTSNTPSTGEWQAMAIQEIIIVIFKCANSKNKKTSFVFQVPVRQLICYYKPLNSISKEQSWRLHNIYSWTLAGSIVIKISPFTRSLVRKLSLW